MGNKCKHCDKLLAITPNEKAYCEKMDVPLPTHCLRCRQQKLYAYRNERSLYQRSCDHCKKPMIAMFSPDSDKTVYCRDCWWSDEFEPRDYGREFDFDRPFFDQLAALLDTVPLASLAIGDSENSEYTNYAMWNKNCYLVSSSDYNEDSFYSTYVFRCTDSSDCLFTSDSELCYECIDCKHCYDGTCLQNCTTCSECLFCYNCRSSQNCIGCVNLSSKEFHILNEPCSREEFEKRKADILANPEAMEAFRAKFEKFRLDHPHKFAELDNCENVSGDHLRRCKNCFGCFDLVESEDCFNIVLGIKSKDCMDCMGVTSAELCYQSIGCPGNYNMKFTMLIWPKSSYLEYCLFCRASKNCFGCVSLHKNEYCILNKQYTKEEYEAMVPKIIAHMKEHGEYGELFPLKISPFPYEDTVAADYFPL